MYSDCVFEKHFLEDKSVYTAFKKQAVSIFLTNCFKIGLKKGFFIDWINLRFTLIFKELSLISLLVIEIKPAAFCHYLQSMGDFDGEKPF
jgi:hypothetical protein